MIPVVVSAGLAVGTFCGLLFGVGTGDKKHTGNPPVDAAVPVPIDAAVPIDAPIDAPEPEPDAAPEPESQIATLTFKVAPPGTDVEITVDGKPVDGDSFEVELEDGKKTVQIQATAKGFRPLEKRLKVTGDTTVPLLLRKKGGDVPGPRPRPPGPIIDL